MKKIISFFLSVFIIQIMFTDAAYSQLGHNNMYLLANINTHTTPYSAVWGFKAPNGREYAIIGTYDGTQFVDITDVSNIHEVDFIPSTNPSSSNNQWREMKTYSNYAYIVSEVGNSGIQIADLQYLPDSVRYVKKFLAASHTSTHSISQYGPYLYLNGCNSTFGQGVVVMDLTVNPETPVKRGSYNTEYVHDCRVFNDTIYAANIYSGRVSIINAVNKNSLNLVTNFVNLSGSGPHNTALTADRKYLLVTDEIGTAPYRLKIWNIEDLGDITFITSWQPTGITSSIVHNVEVYGYYALIAHYSAGVRLVDFSTPSAPVEVAWYDTYPGNDNQNYNGCWGVYMFPSGKIIASDRQTGLYVLKTYFNITLSIEGLYNSSTNRLNRKDTVTAYLREASSPFNIVDSAKAVIDSVTLTGNFKFNNSYAGNYYIALKHRNSIQTWSKTGGENYNPMAIMKYDFTIAQDKAFGNNMLQVDSSPLRFALYSGDANQDMTIDGSDLSLISNDAENFIIGYVSADLNGDRIVDGADILIAENNSQNFIIAILP
ncbi:MAG: hypothetical protein HGGPFJEG_02451 [Ignavibacteria bacterium]|nr:hypothetical protein [Ignavibacteria bacterium]